MRTDRPSLCQVQPDLEQLDANMEDNEGAEEANKEEMKLGKLQFSLDYDFQKGEVVHCVYTRLGPSRHRVYSVSQSINP